MRAVARGVRLARRTALYATAAGGGYVLGLAQSSEETVPQLVAGTYLQGRLRLLRSLRTSVESLGGGSSLKVKLSSVIMTKDDELSWLESTAQWAESGLESRYLHRVILAHLCASLEPVHCRQAAEGADAFEDEQGPEQPAEATEQEQEGARAATLRVVALLDRKASALGPCPGPEVLHYLAAGLRTITEEAAKDTFGQLGLTGVLHLARATTVATHWLADELRGDVTTSATLHAPATDGAGALSPERAEEMQRTAESLCVVWRALAQPGSPAVLKRRWGPASSQEVKEMRQSIDELFGQLQHAPPRRLGLPPFDLLPAELRRVMAKALKGGKQRAKEEAAPKQGQGLVACAALALGLLIGGLTVLASKDGLGVSSIHVVPEPLREHVRTFVQQRAAAVQDTPLSAPAAHGYEDSDRPDALAGFVALPVPELTTVS